VTENAAEGLDERHWWRLALSTLMALALISCLITQALNEPTTE
jgi:hypothetical protein